MPGGRGNLRARATAGGLAGASCARAGKGLARARGHGRRARARAGGRAGFKRNSLNWSAGFPGARGLLTVVADEGNCPAARTAPSPQTRRQYIELAPVIPASPGRQIRRQHTIAAPRAPKLDDSTAFWRPEPANSTSGRGPGRRAAGNLRARAGGRFLKGFVLIDLTGFPGLADYLL